MLTIAPVVFSHHRRKDGTYNVKIRVTWKGVNKYIATNLWCSKDDLTRSLKIKTPAIVDAAARLVKELRDSVSDLSPALMENLTTDDIVRLMKAHRRAESFQLDFFAYGDQFAAKKNKSTAHAYTMALGALERFIGQRSLDVNDITKALLLDFVKAVDESPKMHYNVQAKTWDESDRAKQPHGQSYRHIAKLTAIYNAARDEFNDEDAGLMLIPRNPFKAVKVEAPKTVKAQNALPVETIQRIIDAELVENDPSIRIALATFLLSFGTMGANLADLYEARPFKGDTWVYYRMKTRERREDRAEMRVTIQPQVCRYIAQLQGDKRWWLGGLHDLNPKADQITARIDRALRRWCDREGVGPFTFYAARHSWATIARSKAMIDKATVDEALDHVGDYQLADIYLEKDWSIINKANTEVLALFDFHESGSSSAGSAQ